MIKLFKNIALLILIYFVVSQFAVNSLPFSWGNTRLNSKYQAYKKNADEYNTILMGASTTYRHIDPTILDEYMKENAPDLEIHSFNFGIPANRTPQSIYSLNVLLDEYGDNIDYIVLDLSELTKMGVDNLHKKEMLYWYTKDNILSIVNTSYESEKGLLNQIGVPVLYVFSYVEKLLMVGMGAAMLEQHAGLNVERLSLGPDGNGYYSLDQEMIDDPEGDLALRYSILRTQDTIDFRTEQCLRLYEKFHDVNSGYSKTMSKELSKLIKKCNSRDIKIVVMLSQRLGDRYEYLIPLHNSLPEANKLSYANPSAYPFLNDRENLFDLAHLNKPGSKLFTQLFAGQFLDRIRQQQEAGNQYDQKDQK